MGKNSDTKNIFDSYFGEVLLKEAVKLTENAGGNSTPTYDNDPNFLKAALKNPNLDAETKGKLENRLKQLESGSNNPPAGTMSVDQAKQAINQQQAQNSTPSQGTVEYEDESPRYKPNDELPEDPALASITAPIQPATPQKALEPVAPPTQTASVVSTQPATTRPSGGFDETANLKATAENEKLDPMLRKIAQDRLAELSKQPQTQQATQPKAQSSGGGSVVDYLAGSGQASDFGSRSKLAAQYGIQGYKGTAEQNTQLLSKLKSGEKPSAQPAAQQAATQPAAKQQGMGGAVGAVSKGIGSAGNVAKRAAVGNQPLGGALGAISKGIGSVGNVAKRALVGDNKPKETEKKEESEEGFVRFEKTNIAKFLKCLSEKNYSKANKYLKAIVENKVKKNIMRGINTL